MTKTKLNNIFNENYKDLLNYSLAATKRFNMKNYEHSLLSECYIHLDRKIKDLKTPADVISYAKTFMKNQLRWSGSPFRKKEFKREEEYQDTKNNHESVLEDSEEMGEPYYDLDLEFFVNDLYKEFQQELSQYERRLFNIYTIQRIRKGKEVAKHLNISTSYAFKIILEAKPIEERFRNFIKSNVI